MAFEFVIPGVYQEPRLRSAEALPRTDVAGFIGFERRVRDGSTPCGVTGSPPIGHAFQVDVVACELRAETHRLRIAAVRDLVLSQAPIGIPQPVGGSICYALVAVAIGTSDDATLVVVTGSPAGHDHAAPPSDAQVALAASGAPHARLVDVLVRRPAAGTVRPIVLPRDRFARCDDWTDFELRYGGDGDRDGALLGDAVRAYFVNGGRRCWISVVARPRFDDATGLAFAREQMIGLSGTSEREATGLERILIGEEVAVIDAPDLYARRSAPDAVTLPLPPRELAACFRSCEEADVPGAIATGDAPIGDPIFDELAVLDAQRRMIVRVAPDAWRALLVLAAPVEFDPAVGAFGPPSPDRAAAWRTALAGAVDDERISCTAFYHPWVVAQDRVAGPLREMPPTPFAAGVIARRDLARGPHIAPANEVVRGVVAVTHPIDDATHAELAVSPGHVNLIRPFPGHGIQLWGARTLSGHATLRYLGARRCLSAIERRAAVAFRRLVFEPNTPGLWFLLAQTMTGILTPVFEAGALAGSTPGEAFTVRCDASINPPDQIQLGRVLCEVSVALAATGELVVFRLRRADAAIVVEEAS